MVRAEDTEAEAWIIHHPLPPHRSRRIPYNASA